jgi:coenzyme F420-0:L-glutamate ligase/coenzyme F420-1:gamma-L-glutamate ligase
LNSIRRGKENLEDKDILVITHKIISKSEGQVVDLRDIIPSFEARKIAEVQKRDPRMVELIILESSELIRLEKGVIISETKHGLVCANAGIDASNVDKDDNKVTLLPKDPDGTARMIREEIKLKEDKDVGIVITDTFGRPFREGQINIAIGISGVEPIISYIGEKDMYGKSLRKTEIAVADEIASAAELVMKKSLRIPAAIVRGWQFEFKKVTASRLIRLRENDFFRDTKTI